MYLKGACVQCVSSLKSFRAHYRSPYRCAYRSGSSGHQSLVTPLLEIGKEGFTTYWMHLKIQNSHPPPNFRRFDPHLSLKLQNAVVLNAVGRRNTQMSAETRKWAQKHAEERKSARAQKSAKELKRAQKIAKERYRVKIADNQLFETSRSFSMSGCSPIFYINPTDCEGCWDLSDTTWLCFCSCFSLGCGGWGSKKLPQNSHVWELPLSWSPTLSEKDMKTEGRLRLPGKDLNVGRVMFGVDHPFSRALHTVFRGGTNRVFGEPWALCPLPQTGCFDENDESDEFTSYPLKTRLRSSDPQKRRKWRVSLRQRDGLEKAGIALPWH